MTSAAELIATMMAEEADPDGALVPIPRDRWGRPLIPDPATGKVRAWTRTTTLTKTLSDTYNLERWGKRMVAEGMARSRPLVVRALAAKGDRDALDEVAEAAMTAAGASDRAEMGTAVHKLCELRDLGEELGDLGDWQADVDAYTTAMAEHELMVAPGWVERFVVCPEVGAAGTPDRLAYWEGLYPFTRRTPELPVIVDIKTGDGVIKYAGLETAGQLAVYAHATHWWDGKELRPMPRVDHQVGLVLHMPVGTGECTVYTVDLDWGWKVARMSAAVREMRKGGKRAFTLL